MLILSFPGHPAKQLTNLLEDVQRRAPQITVGNTPYTEACCMLCIQSLADRRAELCRTLFKQIVNNEFHSLHYLLPAKRDTQLISLLGSTTLYQTLHARTYRFKNLFLPYSLYNLVHIIPAERSGVVVEYRTRNREVAGSTHTRSTASNLEQVANLVCAQANSASYPQRDRK